MLTDTMSTFSCLTILIVGDMLYCHALQRVDGG